MKTSKPKLKFLRSFAPKMIRRLLATNPRQDLLGNFVFDGGYIDAEFEEVNADTHRLFGAREAATRSEIEENSPSSPNLALLERLAERSNSFVTTIGFVSTEAPLAEAVGQRILLDRTNGWKTVAVEGKAKLYRTDYIRAIGNVGSPAIVISRTPLEPNPSFFDDSPWHELDSPNDFLALPDVLCVVAFRDADFVLPIHFAAASQKEADRMLEILKEEGLNHLFDSNTVIEGLDQAKRTNYFQYQRSN